MLLHMLILYLSQALVGLSSEELCSSPQKRELGDTKTQELEKAVILVKPDGVQRGYVGKIISRFEQKGFQLIAMKMEMAERSTLEDHYEEHAGKSFYTDLIDYMMSGPVVPMVWQGNNIVKIARNMLGATDPLESAPGTIRGDYGVSKQKNLLHISDSPESALREILIWFKNPEKELITLIDPMQLWK